ncbi:MAG: M28 family peptidase [Candidatus Lokiarchaeota archaeon]
MKESEISTIDQNLNENKLYEYIEDFSFPRLAGTKGEKKAVKKAKDVFKKIGFKDDQITLEDFTFSDFYSTTLVKLIMMMNLTFQVFLLVLAYIIPVVGIVLVAIVLIIVLLIIRGLKTPEEPGFWGKYYGEFHSATNVITKIPAKVIPEKLAPNIIISAHLDSKSQTFKTAWRIVLYRLWLFSGIFLGGCYIFLFTHIFTFINFNLRVLEIFIWVGTMLIVVSNLFLIFLNTNNKSPGALDNASGMAVVFELSSYFIDNPLKHFNLYFCQFSAEELGTMGSRIFVSNREEIFDKNQIFQINFDMVSCKGHKFNRVEFLKTYGVFPRRKIAPVLGSYLEKAAEEEQIEINGFHLTTGAHLDSVPFHLRGYSAVDITTRSAARYTHDITDTPDKVDPKVLLEACLIAKKTISMIDDDYESLCKNNEIKCEE